MDPRITGAGDGAALDSAFAAAMAAAGPHEPAPALAIAVSGGADSMALAILARDWARARGGTVLGLIVDHGLRAGAAAEAALTAARLAKLGVPARILPVTGLSLGPGLAERARHARYDALLTACAAAGVAHLLLGHHRGDQVETVMLRVLSGSQGRGLAGMALVTETRSARLIRPLLAQPPGLLRAFLTDLGVGWVEDPSNRDPGAARARLRAARDDPGGDRAGTGAVFAAAREAGRVRGARDVAIARVLATRATIRPEGYALLTPGSIDPEALATLLRAIGGAAFSPPIERVAAQARALGPATLGGVRIARGGRFGPVWLVVREQRSMALPVAAGPNAEWDGRFRLIGYPADAIWDGLRIGPSGGTPPSALPAAIGRTLPAIWRGLGRIAVPHLGLGDSAWQFVFSPRNPVAGAPFASG